MKEPRNSLVGDNKRYLGFKLPSIPPLEQVYKAMIVLRDQDSCPLGHAGVAQTPVQVVFAGQGNELSIKLFRTEVETSLVDLHAQKETAFATGLQVLVDPQDTAAMPLEKRGDRRYQTLLIRAGYQ